jgi:hypothetical protein
MRIHQHRRELGVLDTLGDQIRAATIDIVLEDRGSEPEALQARSHLILKVGPQYVDVTVNIALGPPCNSARKVADEIAVIKVLRRASDRQLSCHTRSPGFAALA